MVRLHHPHSAAKTEPGRQRDVRKYYARDPEGHIHLYTVFAQREMAVNERGYKRLTAHEARQLGVNINNPTSNSPASTPVIIGDSLQRVAPSLDRPSGAPTGPTTGRDRRLIEAHALLGQAMTLIQEIQVRLKELSGG